MSKKLNMSNSFLKKNLKIPNEYNQFKNRFCDNEFIYIKFNFKIQ